MSEKMLSKSEIAALEEQEKNLREKISKAKKALAKKEAEDEKRRRTKQMLDFCEKLEKSFQEHVGPDVQLFSLESEEDLTLEKIITFLRKNYFEKEFLSAGEVGAIQEAYETEKEVQEAIFREEGIQTD